VGFERAGIEKPRSVTGTLVRLVDVPKCEIVDYVFELLEC
jgi:hypothetical protein